MSCSVARHIDGFEGGTYGFEATGMSNGLERRLDWLRGGRKYGAIQASAQGFDAPGVVGVVVRH